MILKKIDRIVIDIEVNDEFEKYVFPCDQVRQVNDFFKVCQDFGSMPDKLSYESIKPFFGDKILASTSKPQLLAFIDHYFLKEKIIRTELIGFKIINNMATLYINYYYQSGPQTYAITFALNSSERIEGITVPGKK